MHEEKINVVGIVDNEGFVAGWHQVACFFIRTISDLGKHVSVLLSLKVFVFSETWTSSTPPIYILSISCPPLLAIAILGDGYRDWKAVYDCNVPMA